MSGSRLELGTPTTVFVDSNTGDVRCFDGEEEREGLRDILVIDRERPDPYDDPDSCEPAKVMEINVVSTYSLHVALYALQNPTPETIEKTLHKIGVSGDCEEYSDDETLMPLPVPEPPGWTDGP